MYKKKEESSGAGCLMFMIFVLAPILIVVGIFAARYAARDVFWGPYASEDRKTILVFEDLFYLITEDDVVPAEITRSADGSEIYAIGGKKFDYTLSEDGKTLTVDGITYTKISSFPKVLWRQIKAASQYSIEDSRTGVLGWLLSPAAFRGNNSWGNYGLYGAALADIGIIAVIVILVRMVRRGSRKKN